MRFETPGALFRLPNLLLLATAAFLLFTGVRELRVPAESQVAEITRIHAADPDSSDAAVPDLPVLRLNLPTDNVALLEGDGPAFYMFTDRNFNGVRSTPWEAGQFGFVRNPKNTRDGLVFTRFHAGVDIRPVRRDRQGNPLDRVRAIDDGKVVYVNRNEQRSNYGLYVVVEHDWNGAPYYSLYAHLNEISVAKDQRVKAGDDLGLLGFTGVGIDRRRAHLHLEVNMMMNRYFQTWYDRGSFRTRNFHGAYNGMNMVGVDVASLYLAVRQDSTLTLPDFIRQKEVFFEVAVPNEGALDLLYRYPWLLSHHPGESYGSWIISFTQYGLPVRIAPSIEKVGEPTVVHVAPSRVAYADLTRGLLEGMNGTARLSSRGLRHIELITTGSGR